MARGGSGQVVAQALDDALAAILGAPQAEDPADLEQAAVVLDGEALILSENVFRIQQVVSSSEKDQVRLRIDGRVYSLAPGEVLLLLG